MRNAIQLCRAVIMMSVFFAAGSLFSGCSETPTAGPDAHDENSANEQEDPGPVPQGQGEPESETIEEDRISLPIPDQSSKSPSPATSPTHVITQQVVYYKSGPQQSIPPDGKMEPGTKVCVVRNAGGYAEVKAENGIQGYIVADSLKPLDIKK